MFEPLRASIDLKALRHNLSVARSHAQHSKLVAVVKSLAYGHGAIEIAKALQDDADVLAVARINEAVELREAGIEAEILVLEGFCNQQEMTISLSLNLQVVVHQPHQIQLLQTCSEIANLSCWLKLDTGMHRLGFPYQQADQLMTQLQACAAVKELVLMTHFANADDLTNSSTAQQVEYFEKAMVGNDVSASLANSAAILAYPQSHYDWVRPGIMLYGSCPVIGQTAEHYNLQSVMTLSAPLIATNAVLEGESVGYGSTWQADRAMTVGVIGIGYGDGYPRHIGDNAFVLIKGKRAAIIGRVSMDMISIDLTGMDAHLGDPVVLWGKGLPVDEVATWAGTIGYTLLCGVSARVPRHYINRQ